MRECLRGWRRKIGVVTLLLACVLMIGWVRSFSCDDFVDVWINRHSTFHVIASNSSLTFCYAWNDGGEANEVILKGTTVKETLGNSSKLVDWRSFPLEETVVEYFAWDWDLSGFSFAAYNHDPIHKRAIRVSNAHFVVPLTVISAYLLLSKSRQSTWKKVSQPVHDERGATS